MPRDELLNGVQTEKPKPWVRLHLVPQTEESGMPQWIVGRLEQELPQWIVLSNVIEADEDSGEPMERKHRDMVNRTYVWRCEILGINKPKITSEADDEWPGGMG